MRSVAAMVGWLLIPLPLAAQTGPWSRADAVAAALAHDPRFAGARADSAGAVAALDLARRWTNPILSLGYTRDIPRYHATLDMPISDFWLRRPRVDAATDAAEAARARLALEERLVILDADTLYTRAVAAAAHAALSSQNAVDADSIAATARRRRDAGDASDLDVEIAELAAGAEAKIAAADSVAAVTSALALQSVVGLGDGMGPLVFGDSLALPPAPHDSGIGTPLAVTVASAALAAAESNVTTQRRSLWAATGITFGFDAGDPTGEEPGLLPTVGVAVPLPLFSQNRENTGVAVAARDRARADLDATRRETAVRIATARITLDAATARAIDSRDLVRRAERVAALSLTAYREGAMALASVLEAQRTAREIRASYIDDVANAMVASSLLRALLIAGVSPT